VLGRRRPSQTNPRRAHPETQEQGIEALLSVVRGDDGVAWLTLDRPEQRNAFDWAMLRRFGEELDELEAIHEVRVVIIRSALKRVFVAGGDIAVMRDLDGAEGSVFVKAGQDLLSRLERSRLVFIAAIGGFALGGGFELALACDLVVAGAGATFAMPETTIGLLPGWGGTQRLVRTVSPQRARELVYTGRRIGAAEAYSLGIVTVLAGEDDVEEQTLDLARSVLRSSPTAVSQSKRALNVGGTLTLDAGLVVEAAAWLKNLESVNRVEGLSAFLEKREPRFVTQERAGS
jgi:enoyl-CoA hydratase/carnithine racemase